MKNNLQGIIATSKTLVKCNICDVHIPKANRCIEQHVTGKRHLASKEIMKENGVSFRKNQLFCKACEAVLDEGETVNSHIEKEEHVNWISTAEELTDDEFIGLDDFLKSDPDDRNIVCNACYQTFPCTLQNLQDHTNEFSHGTNVVIKLKPLNGIFSVDNDYEVWCKLCDDYVDNDIDAILDHIDEDEEHVKTISELKQLEEDHGIDVNEYLSEEYKKVVFCNKCNVNITVNRADIESHIYSESHLNSLNSVSSS